MLCLSWDGVIERHLEKKFCLVNTLPSTHSQGFLENLFQVNTGKGLNQAGDGVEKNEKCCKGHRSRTGLWIDM